MAVLRLERFRRNTIVSLVAALLSRCVFDGWQARVRKYGDIVRFTAGVILIGGLLGFIEETIDVLFTAWRKTMQALWRFVEQGVVPEGATLKV